MKLEINHGVAAFQSRNGACAIVWRWCCHVGWNDFLGAWQIVIAIRQHCSLHWLTILTVTTELSVPITEIAVNVMSWDGTRQLGSCLDSHEPRPGGGRA